VIQAPHIKLHTYLLTCKYTATEISNSFLWEHHLNRTTTEGTAAAAAAIDDEVSTTTKVPTLQEVSSVRPVSAEDQQPPLSQVVTALTEHSSAVDSELLAVTDQ